MKMAPLAVTVTVIFSMLVLSNALPPLDTQEKTEKSVLFLPSEKTESEPERVVDAKPVSVSTTTEEQLPERSDSDTNPIDDLRELETKSVELTKPFAVISFRPINRPYFHLRRQFPFRFPRRCRHGHVRGGRMIPTRMAAMPKREISFGDDMILSSGEARKREVSYGNDMILSSGENSDYRPKFHGGEEERQIPAKKMRFNYHDHDVREKRGFPMKRDEFENSKFQTEFRGGEEEEELPIPAKRMRFHFHHHDIREKRGFPMKKREELENSDFPPEFLGGEEEEEERQIPAKRMRFPFHHNDIREKRAFPMKKREGFDMMPRHHHHHHHHGHDFPGEEREEMGERGGFTMKIRKFLNRFLEG